MKYQDKRGEQSSENVMTNLHFSPKSCPQTKHNIQLVEKLACREKKSYFFNVASLKASNF